MLRLSRDTGWRPGRDLPFLALLVAVCLGTFPTIGQRSLDVAAMGTELTLAESDVAFLVLGVLVVVRLLGRARLPEPARAVTYAGAAFAGWLLASSLLNGVEAAVGALRLLEYGVLALGVVLFVQRRSQLVLLVAVVVALAVAAGLIALRGVAENGLERQYSYLGTHDFAALGTMALAVGLTALYASVPRSLAVTAAVAGGVGVALGAAVAGLLGLYLAVGAIVALAAARRVVTPRRLTATALVLLVVTGAVLGLRLGDFGAGEQEDDGGGRRGSAKVRLLHAYIAGRVFLDNPLVGTGWYGNLPPEEYGRFVPDARRAFPDLPPHYFPTPPDEYVPQQTYDQVLAELGLVGAALFLAFGILVGRTVIGVGLRWPREGADEWLAFVPAAWLAALAGALAGEALYGGGAIATFFWLTVGIAAVAPSLVPPRPVPPPLVTRREHAAVA